MKKLLFILLFSFIAIFVFAQNDTGNAAKAANDTTTGTDTTIPKVAKKEKKTVTSDAAARRTIADTIRTNDTLPAIDTLTLRSADTAKPFVADTSASYASDTAKKFPPVIAKKPFDTFYRKLLDNPFITKAKPIYLVLNERERQYKDNFFYLLCGLLLFLAFIRLVFSRYFRSIFRLFFQPSFRQKQTREQLLQSNLPSLLLNLFFIFSAGTYITFLLQFYHFTDISFWWLLLYTNMALLALYLGKFIFLSFAGWVFNVKEATDTYIFAVYLINKITGVVLMPFTVLIAFAQSAVINIAVTISLLLILLLYIYRYIVSYAPVRREVKVSILHFFLLYLCLRNSPPFAHL